MSRCMERTPVSWEGFSRPGSRDAAPSGRGTPPACGRQQGASRGALGRLACPIQPTVRQLRCSLEHAEAPWAGQSRAVRLCPGRGHRRTRFGLEFDETDVLARTLAHQSPSLGLPQDARRVRWGQPGSLSESPLGQCGRPSVQRWLQREHLGGDVRVSVVATDERGTRWRVTLMTAAVASRLYAAAVSLPVPLTVSRVWGAIMLLLKSPTASASTQVTTLPRISVRPLVGALPAYRVHNDVSDRVTSADKMGKSLMADLSPSGRHGCSRQMRPSRRRSSAGNSAWHMEVGQPGAGGGR